MAKSEQVLKKTSIGGQALIEGIMMRGPEKTAMAVRHVSGEIVIEEWATSGSKRAKFWKLPLIRGIYNFVDSMYFGYKCLMRSAELSGLEDEEEPAGKGGAAAASAADDAGEAGTAGSEAEAVLASAALSADVPSQEGAPAASQPAAGTARLRRTRRRARPLRQRAARKKRGKSRRASCPSSA